MIATIELEEMEFYAYHGCFVEEQRVGNRFIVNISMEIECSRAAESDNICDALNYVDVYHIVKEEIGIKSHLLENVAKRITNRIRTSFDPQTLISFSVKVSKMAPPVGGQMKCVSLTMKG